MRAATRSFSVLRMPISPTVCNWSRWPWFSCRYCCSSGLRRLWTRASPYLCKYTTCTTASIKKYVSVKRSSCVVLCARLITPYYSSIWGRTNSYLWRIQMIWPLRMLDRKWHHRKSRDLFPYLFSRTVFPRTFFPVLFSRILFPLLFFPYFFTPYSPRTFSKVATFEIQRFKISVSCFSSTCYNTVHVPCGISIQT